SMRPAELYGYTVTAPPRSTRAAGATSCSNRTNNAFRNGRGARRSHVGQRSSTASIPARRMASAISCAYIGMPRSMTPPKKLKMSTRLMTVSAPSSLHARDRLGERLLVRLRAQGAPVQDQRLIVLVGVQRRLCFLDQDDLAPGGFEYRHLVLHRLTDEFLHVAAAAEVDDLLALQRPFQSDELRRQHQNV